MWVTWLILNKYLSFTLVRSLTIGLRSFFYYQFGMTHQTLAQDLWRELKHTKKVKFKLTGRTTTMGTEEFLLQQREIEGIERGIKTGIKETEARKNHDFVENLIVKLALSDEQAADVAEVSLSFVKKVRKEIASRK